MVHLQRFSDQLELFIAFPNQKYWGIHIHQLLIAGQYIAEHYFLIRTNFNNFQIRTHDLARYLDLFNEEKHLTDKTKQFLLDYLNLKKGCDYPFWNFYTNQGANLGMKWLNLGFQLTNEEDGFIPSHLPKTTFANMNKELLCVTERMNCFLNEILTSK